MHILKTNCQIFNEIFKRIAGFCLYEVLSGRPSAKSALLESNGSVFKSRKRNKNNLLDVKELFIGLN